ncbi:hypothetical protein SGUI_1570 [Serinicoccus hydrothermalis]|uniref:DUF559 domain-containing protein n=1 Tax=Serinicoccus hydrothermalis TaxID=1758689 RepID=A0A1B1NC12_9MICO|nr:hypothetical protein SGUI_1570 [Serinicoccus hydrothermalis]
MQAGQQDLVLRLLERGHGTVLGRELFELGLTPETTRVLVSRKLLVRAGRGAFIDGAAYASADPEGRHVLRSVALARTWPPGVLVSHSSGALLHDLPLVQPVGDRVHGCRRTAGQHRRRKAYTIHTGYADATWTTIRGVQVLEPRLVVMGVAELHGRDAAVAAADAGVHRGLVQAQDLRDALVGRDHHPAHAVMTQVAELVDGRTESPAESLGRLLLVDLGYRPVPQVEIRDAFGAFLGRVDFLLDGTRVVIEIDGMGKYATAEDLAAEKRRELGLRRAGYVVVRLVWSDLRHPGRVRALVEAALATAA